MSRGTVAVVFGGPSPEHDISILTGLQCERILEKAGWTVLPILMTHNCDWLLVPSDSEAKDYLNGPPSDSTRLELRLSSEPGWYRKKGMRTTRVDVDAVFNCFHGSFGESGGAQSLFELMGLPATGGTPTAAALGMDKYAFGALMQSAGIPSLPRVLLTPDSPIDFPGPYIVKPRFGGSSIGIEIASDYETCIALLGSSVHLRRGAVVEPFGSSLIDLNIAFRTAPDFQTSLLERPVREAGEIYSYAEKYLQGSGLSSAPRELPANVPDEVTKLSAEYAKSIAIVTGLTGLVRVDFLYDGTNLYVNEVNSIPGAMALYLWPPEVSATEILSDMVIEVQGAESTTLVGSSTTDGTALRAAGGIAGKLTGLVS